VVAPWRVVLTKQAKKDARNLNAAGLRSKAEDLIAILRVDPLQSPPPFEKLLGDLCGMYSRRINRQHRLVYDVFPERRTVKILRMWTHYGD